MSTLHWKMREILPIMQEEGRLNTLIAMLLRCNIRMRCYPSLETLVSDTGLSIATVNRAKNWLLECGFVVLVPYKLRVDDELKLSRRHNVYQLTGVCTVNGSEIQYLFMTDVAMQELRNRVRDTLQGKVLTSKVLGGKTLNGKDKGISRSKGSSKKNTPLGDVWTDELIPLSDTFVSLTNTLVPPRNDSRYELKAAQTLLNAGVTPEVLRQYYAHTYKGTYTPKSLQEISKGIGAFMAERKTVRPASQPAAASLPPVPALTSDQLAARKAQGQAVRKQLAIGGNHDSK